MCFAASIRKPSTPEVEQRGQVGDDLLLHGGGCGVEVGQVHELAALHLGGVAVVLDVVVRGEAAVVEVGVLVEPRVVVVLEGEPAHPTPAASCPVM